MSPDKGRGAKDSRRRPSRPVDPQQAEQAEAADLSWKVKPASERARKQWKEAAEAEPELLAQERQRLSERPLDRSANPRRTGQLKGGLATRKLGGVTLPQWQQELTAAGRLWYCPDKATRTVWVVMVDLKHPKSTD